MQQQQQLCQDFIDKQSPLDISSMRIILYSSIICHQDSDWSKVLDDYLVLPLAQKLHATQSLSRSAGRVYDSIITGSRTLDPLPRYREKIMAFARGERVQLGKLNARQQELLHGFKKLYDRALALYPSATCEQWHRALQSIPWVLDVKLLCNPWSRVDRLGSGSFGIVYGPFSKSQILTGRFHDLPPWIGYVLSSTLDDSDQYIIKLARSDSCYSNFMTWRHIHAMRQKLGSRIANRFLTSMFCCSCIHTNYNLLLIQKYGGITLSKFHLTIDDDHNTSLILSGIIHSLRDILTGLLFLIRERKIMLSDIKMLNMTIHPQTFEISMIDLESNDLSTSSSSIKTTFGNRLFPRQMIIPQFIDSEFTRRGAISVIHHPKQVQAAFRPFYQAHRNDQDFRSRMAEFYVSWIITNILLDVIDKLGLYDDKKFLDLQRLLQAPSSSSKSRVQSLNPQQVLKRFQQLQSEKPPAA